MRTDRRPCFFCGYDLRGVPGASLCPECGKHQHEARDVIDFRAVGVRRSRWLSGFVLIGAILFLIAYLFVRVLLGDP